MQKSFFRRSSKSLLVVAVLSAAGIGNAQDGIRAHVVTQKGDSFEARLTGADSTQLRLLSSTGAAVSIPFETVRQLDFLTEPPISAVMESYHSGELDKAAADFERILPPLQAHLWIEQAGLSQAFLAWVDALRQKGDSDKAREVLKGIQIPGENGEARKALLTALIDASAGNKLATEQYLRNASPLDATDQDFVVDRILRVRYALLTDQPREAINFAAEALCSADQTHPNYFELLVLAEQGYRRAGGQKSLAAEAGAAQSSADLLMEAEATEDKRVSDPRAEIAVIAPTSYWAKKTDAGTITSAALKELKNSEAPKTSDAGEAKSQQSQEQAEKDIWSQFRTSSEAKKGDE